LVQRHVKVAGNWLAGITVMGDITEGVKYHHERIDGKGYAEGLSGVEIPLAAKIICVCNAFDSMMSHQPHRKALSVKKAQSELIASAGTQFDQQIVGVLIALINEGEVPLKE